MFYDMTRKRWPLNICDCLIEVTTWAGLTVYWGGHMGRFDCILRWPHGQVWLYIEVTKWAGLTVYWGDHMGRFDCIWRWPHGQVWLYIEVTTWAGVIVYWGDNMGSFDCILRWQHGQVWLYIEVHFFIESNGKHYTTTEYLTLSNRSNISLRNSGHWQHKMKSGLVK